MHVYENERNQNHYHKHTASKYKHIFLWRHMAYVRASVDPSVHKRLHIPSKQLITYCS